MRITQKKTHQKIGLLKIRVLNAFLVYVLMVIVGPQTAGATNAGISYHGRLIDPSGNAVIGASVQFKIQLRTPGAENCLMYEEVQNKDMSQSDGVFAIVINDGSGTRTDSSGYTLEQIFGNRGSFTFSASDCSGGTVYIASPSDGRKIQVLFNDGTFTDGQWETTPPISVSFVPMAIEAAQIGGYKKEQLLKIADGVSTTGTELNNASWTELLALIGGTTTQYVKAGAANFTAAPQWNGTPSSANDLVNKTYVDAQVLAGLPNVGTAGTYTKVTTDAKGRVTSGTALVEADIPTLSTAGKVSGSSINAGAIGGSASINSSGNLVTSGTVQGAIVNATNLRVFNGANYVQLGAPALGGNVNFSLPAADGAAGTLMKTNGAGQLSFTALSASDIPSLDAAKITTGTLPVARGGTGLTSYGNNSVLVSNGTGSAISSLNCALGEVVKFDATGFAGCGTDSTGSGSQWTTTGSDIYYTTGKVGIGITAPTTALEIAGDLSFSSGVDRIIKVQNSFSTNANSLTINGANVASGTGIGGGITLQAGYGRGAAAGGSVGIAGGTGGATGPGGAISILGGFATGAAQLGGSVTVQGGTSSTFTGGELILKGGQSSSASGVGGQTTIVGGAGAVGNGSGGNVLIDGGPPTGSGTRGIISLASTGGNVGIGTATPNALLDVNGTMRVSQICDSAGANCKTVSGGWSAAAGLSSLTAAIATDTIDNTNYAQAWNWSTATTESAMSMSANALTTGSLMSLTSSSASLNSTNGLLNVANTSASTTGIVARIQSNSTASSGLSVMANGRVGVGTSSPTSTLQVVGTNAAAGNAEAALTVVGGTGGANSKGGNLVLTGGTGGAGAGTGIGGDIIITSGQGGPSFGRAGAVTISGGSGGDGGGLVTVQGGYFSSSLGAKLLLNAGDSSTTGSASLTTGYGGGITASVGGITLQTGSATMGGNVGNIVISGGAGNGVGTGSNILVTAGAGGATNVNGSNIVLNGGAKGGSGSDGNVILADSRGSVGIGTASPNANLTIKSAANGTTNFNILNSAGNAIFKFSDDGYGRSQFAGYDNANVAKFGGFGWDQAGPFWFINASNRNKPDGSASADGLALQIVTPASVGQENGIFFTNNLLSGKNGAAITFYTSDAADWGRGGLKFKTSGAGTPTTQMTIDPTGNVGVGTTSPQTTLQVAGVISPATNNTYTLGNATYRFTEVYATNGVINTSDRREKKDIYNTDLGLDFINKLRPVSYRWNTGVDNDIHYGLIAQEAEQVIAEVGKTEKTSIVTHDEATDRYGVRYSELISPLIKAVQEIYQKLIGIESSHDALVSEIASVKARAEVESASKDKEIAELKAYLCSHDKNAPFCK